MLFGMITLERAFHPCSRKVYGVYTPPPSFSPTSTPRFTSMFTTLLRGHGVEPGDPDR